MSEKPINPLRRRMIEDMTVRNFVEKTRNDYIRHVKTSTAFPCRSPDTATTEDSRRFQLHQTETGVRPPAINGSPPEPGSGPLGPIRKVRKRLVTTSTVNPACGLCGSEHVGGWSSANGLKR